MTSCACVWFWVFILSLAFSRMEQMSLGELHQECDGVDLGCLATLRASVALGNRGLSYSLCFKVALIFPSVVGIYGL